MDPTPDGTGAGHHPDEERLADYAGGALEPGPAAEVAAHVAGCPPCSAAVERIGTARAALAALPPVPMPTEVVERVDRALAAAAAEAARRPGVTVLAERRRWTHRLPGAAAAAAVVAIVGAVAFGAWHGTDGSGGDRGSASGGAAAPAGASAGAARAPARLVTNHTGRHYTVDSLRAAVPALLDGSLADRSPQEQRPAAGGAPAPLDSPAVRTCGQHLGGGETPLLAVDYAYFRDRPAVILIYADEDPSRVDIFVGGPDCVTDPDPIPQLIVANR